MNLQSLKVLHLSVILNGFHELPSWKIGCLNYARFTKSGYIYLSLYLRVWIPQWLITSHTGLYSLIIFCQNCLQAKELKLSKLSWNFAIQPSNKSWAHYCACWVSSYTRPARPTHCQIPILNCATKALLLVYVYYMYILKMHPSPALVLAHVYYYLAS